MANREAKELQEYIRSYVEETFTEQADMAQLGGSSTMVEHRDIIIGITLEWEKAKRRISNGTSTGSDGISLLGPITKKLRKTINSIFQGREVPDVWELSRTNLLYKGR